MPPIIRSVLSVLGAFVVVSILVLLSTLIASRLMLGSIGLAAEPTTPFLIVNVTYSVLFAIVGGYIAATVADHSPIGHAAALAVFMMLLGLTSGMMNSWQPAPGQPNWYPWIMSLLVPPVAVVGGILVTRRSQARTQFSKRARESGGVP